MSSSSANAKRAVHTVLITGANRGLGLEAARQLSRRHLDFASSSSSSSNPITSSATHTSATGGEVQYHVLVAARSLTSAEEAVKLLQQEAKAKQHEEQQQQHQQQQQQKQVEKEEEQQATGSNDDAADDDDLLLLTPVELDVTNNTSIDKAVAAVTAALDGGGSTTAAAGNGNAGRSNRSSGLLTGGLDVLINNAGITTAPDKKGLVPATNMDALRNVLETNLLATIAVTNAFLPLLQRAPSRVARIVNVSSRIGSHDTTEKTLLLVSKEERQRRIAERGKAPVDTAYAMSKSALNMYTQNLASTMLCEEDAAEAAAAEAEASAPPNDKETTKEEKEEEEAVQGDEDQHHQQQQQPPTTSTSPPRVTFKINAITPGWVRTSMGGPNAAFSVEEGAQAYVALAVIGTDGPTGQFFSRSGRTEW